MEPDLKGYPERMLTGDSLGELLGLEKAAAVRWAKRNGVEAVRLSPKAVRYRLTEVLGALAGQKVAVSAPE